MNGQTIEMGSLDASAWTGEGGLIKKAGRTIASIVCVAFMLDCLADEAWPGPARSG